MLGPLFILYFQLYCFIEKESDMVKPNVENGTCIVDSNNPHIATLKCHSGYQPDGITTSQLDPNTNIWDPPELKCILITTNTLPNVENGTPDTVFRNNQKVQPPYQIHDTVLPKCYNGYEFKGLRAILLPNPNNSQLIWSPSTLTCKAKQIETLPKVVKGKLVPVRTLPDSEYASPKSFAINDYVTIQCDPGYVTKILASIVKEDKNNQLEWQPDTLSCEPMTLRNKPELHNGYYKFNNDPPYYYGDKAEIHCNPGYKSNFHKKYAQVIERGNKLIWDPEKLYCQPMTLNTLPDVKNGTPILKQNIQSPYYIGTQVTIQCQDEHISTVNESKIILDPQTGTLKWEPSTIYCQRINCPKPPEAPVSGWKDGKGRNFGDVIKYRCPPDYEVTGKKSNFFEPIINAEYKCDPLGNWRPELPEAFQCARVHCPELDKPKWAYLSYSRVLDGIATYTCIANKAIVTRTCQQDTTWSGQEPKCPSLGKSYFIWFQYNIFWILLIFLLICLMFFSMIWRHLHTRKVKINQALNK